MSILLSLLISMAFSADEFSKQQRQNYLQGSILSFQASSASSIENMFQFINLLEKNVCRSSYEAMVLPCLRQETQKNCTMGNEVRKKNCAILSDVILVNKVNEKQFISREERFRIARQSSNHKEAYAAVLERKYGMVTTELLLHSKSRCGDKDNECIVKEIDQFCIKNADVKNISWQACAAAIIYFIGTSK